MAILLRNIEYFVELANHKSISSAAEHLYVRQQTLSAAMQNLENELGFPLFNRTPNGIVLTKLGQAFLIDAKKMVYLADYWKNYQYELPKEETEIIELAGGAPFGRRLVQIIALLKKDYPNIKVHFNEIAGPLVPDALKNKKARIGVTSGSADLSIKALHEYAEELGFCIEQVSLSRLFLIVNRKNPLAEEKQVMLNDCRHLNLILRANEQPINGMDVTQYFKSTFELNRMHDVLDLISQCEDMAAFIPYVSYQAESEPFQDQICALKLLDYGLVHPIFLMYPNENHIRKEEKIVVDLIRSLEQTFSYNGV